MYPEKRETDNEGGAGTAKPVVKKSNVNKVVVIVVVAIVLAVAVLVLLA